MNQLVVKTQEGIFFSDLVIWDEENTLVYANAYQESYNILASNTASINFRGAGISVFKCISKQEDFYGDKIAKLDTDIGSYKVLLDSKEILNEKMHCGVIRHNNVITKSNFNDIKECKDVYILCIEDEDTMIFNVLFNKFNIPLMKDFIPYIKRELLIGGMLTPLTIQQGENSYPRFISGYKLENLSEDVLKEIIYEGFQAGVLGLCDKPQKNVEVDNLDSYMDKFGPKIIEHVDKLISPLLLDTENKGTVDVALKRKPFISQARRINGMSKLLKKENFGLFISTMGCGKTLKSLATTELYHKHKNGYKTLIMCPGHLQTNWEEEIAMTIPDAKVKILESLQDVMEAVDSPKDGKNFYIIGKDFLKLSYSESPVVSWSKGYRYSCTYKEIPILDEEGKQKLDEKGGPIYTLDLTNYEGRYVGKKGVGKRRVSKTGWICPECGNLLYDPISVEKAKKANDDEHLIPLDRWSFSSKTKANQFCCHCSAKLWKPQVTLLGGQQESKWAKVAYKTGYTATEKTAFVYKELIEEFQIDPDNKVRPETFRLLNESFNRRIAPMDYLKVKGYKGLFDLVIFDEIHKYANPSGQGAAMHVLSNLGEKVIGLTGTLFNGKAESIWYILWRLCPYRMKQKGYEFNAKSLMEFNREYGAIEEQYVYDSHEDYLAQVRAVKITSPRTVPGISPKLYQEFLINNCIFMDLKDIEIEEGRKILPPFDEQLITLKMNDVLYESYRKIEKSLMEFIKSKSKGSNAILGTMIQTLSTYPDKPNGWNEILNPYNGTVLTNIENLPQQELFPKEEKLLEIVKAEVKQGRRCIVFCTSTNKQDVQPRIEKLLAKEGILAKTMYSTSTSSKKRKDWIKTQVTKGCQVLICNPELVETGLNLLEFPTIIYLQTGYILSTLWQSSRRSWRIGQKKRIKVIYLAYESTVQERAIKLMGSKLKAAASIQGEFSSEGIQALSQNTNILTQLAQELHSRAFGQEEKVLETVWDDNVDLIDVVETPESENIKEPLLNDINLIGQSSLLEADTVGTTQTERRVKIVYTREVKQEETLFKTIKEVVQGKFKPKGKKAPTENQLVLFEF